MDIVLTLLELSTQSVFDDVKRFSPYLNRFQLDVADGIFVPTVTAHPKDYLDELPKEKNIYDFHLMVLNPASYLEYIIKLNQAILGIVLVHSAIHPNINKLRSLYPTLTFGLVINADEDVNLVTKTYKLNDFPVIQVMTVHNGYQGGQFLSTSLNKIEQLRNLYYRNKVFIDGGVNENTIKDICKAPFRPDTLCVGSYLIKAPESEIARRIHLLKACGVL